MELPVDSCWMTSLKGMKEPVPVGKPKPEAMPSRAASGTPNGPVKAKFGPEGRKWLKANGWTMGTPKNGPGLTLTAAMPGIRTATVTQGVRLKKRGSAGLQPAFCAARKFLVSRKGSEALELRGRFRCVP